MSRRVEKATPSVLQVNLSENLTVCSCIASDNQLTVTFLKEEKIDSRGQTILRKQQILCNTAEIDTLKKYLSLLEYFQMYHVFTRENEKTEINSLPKPKYPVPVPVHLDDESLPDEIKEVVREGKVESIVYYGNDYGFQANYKVKYKKEDKNSEFIAYEFFMVDELTK